MGLTLLPSCEVKQANLDHLDALIELENKGFKGDRFTRAQFRHLIHKANSTPLIMTEEGRVIAAAIMLWRKNSKIGRLYTIVVDSSYQGRGLGRLLLEECERTARQHGCTGINLEVRADNKAAIALYEKNGYVVERDLPGYYEDGTSGLRMVKSLA